MVLSIRMTFHSCRFLISTPFLWYFNHYPCFHAKQTVRLNPILSYYGSAIKLLSSFAVIIFHIHMYISICICMYKIRNCIWISI